MSIPSIDAAETMLREAEQMNPGPWGDHSRSAAVNARLIAERCPTLDADAAYVMGLMHDIGRRCGVTHMAHIRDGYRFMLSLGYDEVAPVCLTHSFPVPDIRQYIGHVDIPDADYAFVKHYLAARPYTDYDRLIQLCDAISMPQGAVLIEKRLLDVAVRYGGIPEGGIEKWRATFENKRHFDALAGENVYKLLPGIVENTFEW